MQRALLDSPSRNRRRNAKAAIPTIFEDEDSGHGRDQE